MTTAESTQASGMPSRSGVFATIRSWFPHTIGVPPEQALLCFGHEKHSDSSSGQAKKAPTTAKGPAVSPIQKRTSVGQLKPAIQSDSGIVSQEANMPQDQSTDTGTGGGIPDADVGGVRTIAQIPPLPVTYTLEMLRLSVVQSLMIEPVDDRPRYVTDGVLTRFVLPDAEGTNLLLVDELARRVRQNDSEKKGIDVILSCGDYGATFGSNMTLALMKAQGKGKGVMQRFLRKVSPGKGLEPEYRVVVGPEGSLPLSMKRVLLAVPVITPDNWGEVLQQIMFLRGRKANTSWVGVVCLLKVGNLPDLTAALNMETIVDYH